MCTLAPVCECVRISPSSVDPFIVHAISCILFLHRHCATVSLLPHTHTGFFLRLRLLCRFVSFFTSIKRRFISLIMNDFHKNHVIDDVLRFSNGFSIYRLTNRFNVSFFYTLSSLNAGKTMTAMVTKEINRLFFI